LGSWGKFVSCGFSLFHVFALNYLMFIFVLILAWLTGGFSLLFMRLFNVQSQHDELEVKFFEERAALEAKYQKLYQPLYTKVRYTWSPLLFCSNTLVI
jgi:hypothetical protein